MRYTNNYKNQVFVQQLRRPVEALPLTVQECNAVTASGTSWEKIWQETPLETQLYQDSFRVSARNSKNVYAALCLRRVGEFYTHVYRDLLLYMTCLGDFRVRWIYFNRNIDITVILRRRTTIRVILSNTDFTGNS